MKIEVTISCFGNTGHGSRFIEKTAAEKLVSFILKSNQNEMKMMILKKVFD